MAAEVLATSPEDGDDLEPVATEHDAPAGTRPPSAAGFHVSPPAGFEPVEDYPLHDSRHVADGQLVGIRMYHDSESRETVLVAVWSDGAAGLEDRLRRYGEHTGTVRAGRHVDGTTAVWELREDVGGDLPARTNLAATLPGGAMIWLSGTDIEDVELLYEMLRSVEGTPGSQEPPDDHPGTLHRSVDASPSDP